MPAYQQLIAPDSSGAIAVSTSINHLVGTTALALTRPASTRYLVLHAEQGNFRLLMGTNTNALPATETPAASVADGTGALLIPSSGTLVLPSPASCVIRGYAASSILTYYWI